MEEEIFAPCYKEIIFSEKEVELLQKLKEGKRVRKRSLTPKELNAVGLCYWYGHILPKDYKAAVRWYKASATKGYDVAEHNLYICYSNGTGVKVDMHKAIEWLKKSAKHGYAHSQYLLAERYFMGDGIRKNRRCANIWFKKAESYATNEKDAYLLWFYGRMYLGFDCRAYEINTSKGIDYMQKAAELDFPLAIYFMITHYISASLVEKVEYWMEKCRNCRVMPKAGKEWMERKYSEFLEHIRQTDNTYDRF